MRARLIFAAVLVAAAGGATILAIQLIGEPETVVREVQGGDPQAGRAAIQAFGCTSCHVVPGVVAPESSVGPSLAEFPENRAIAGNLPNTPEALIRWIMDPQEIEPGTVMPDLGVTEPLARDIAAYLYSL